MTNWKQFAKDNQDTINRVCDLLTSLDITPTTGEHILLWVAGLSMGARQMPLAKPEDSIALECLAVAWKAGVEFGDDDR